MAQKFKEKLLNHFGRHWIKWCIFAAIIAIGLSGYKCQTKWFTFEKTKPALPTQNKGDK